MLITVTCYRFENSDELRKYLEDLNEEGIFPLVAGTHGNRWPFLVGLIGPYGESMQVMVDVVPSDNEPRNIDVLQFPVTVFATEGISPTLFEK